MKEKAWFFFEHKISAHIDTLSNSFYNGMIIKCSENILIINDRVLGETPIAFSEIKSIEKFREAEE